MRTNGSYAWMALVCLLLLLPSASLSRSEFPFAVVIGAKLASGVTFEGCIKAQEWQSVAPVGSITIRNKAGVTFTMPCIFSEFHYTDWGWDVTLHFELGDTFLLLSAQDHQNPDRLYPIFLQIIEGRQTFGWEFGLGVPAKPLPLYKEAVQIKGGF